MNNSPERLGSGEIIKSEPTPVELQSRIDRINRVLTRLRAYPSDWTSRTGETKQEVENKLEDASLNMSALLETLLESNVSTPGTELDNLNNVAVRNVLSQLEHSNHEDSASTLTADINAGLADDPNIIIESRIRPTGESDPSDTEGLHQQPKAKFFEINGAYIPIIPRSAHKIARWEAVPSKMTLSGGEKFSEVKFVKDENGLTTIARPGEKMTFI